MPDELVHFLDGLQYICPAFCNPADHARTLLSEYAHTPSIGSEVLNCSPFVQCAL